MGIVDDVSFVTPGSIPFKWEIRPGVPKMMNHKHQTFDHQQQEFHSTHHPQKLKPPPAAGLYYYDYQTTPSFLSAPPANRPRRLDVSQGCFFAKKQDKSIQENIDHEARICSLSGVTFEPETRWHCLRNWFSSFKDTSLSP